MGCVHAGAGAPRVGEERHGFLADVERTQRSPETCPLPLSMNPCGWGLSHRNPG